MSPTSTFVGSTGATVTNWRLRMSGIIEEPLGRNSTVRPSATRAAIPSNAPIERQHPRHPRPRATGICAGTSCRRKGSCARPDPTQAERLLLLLPAVVGMLARLRADLPPDGNEE
jgi:hypothetical protein